MTAADPAGPLVASDARQGNDEFVVGHDSMEARREARRPRRSERE
jgi:hypothetical protein